MKQTRRLVIIALPLLPLLPQCLGWVHFFLHGGLQWSMIWNNEASVWGILLMPFACVPFIYLMRKRHWRASLLPAASMFITLAIFINTGWEPSSKQDDPTLELFGFWFHQWHYW